MALDVHLRRVGDSTWEFKLIGKPNFKISVSEELVPKKIHQQIKRQEEFSSPSSSSVSSSSASYDEAIERRQEGGLYDPVLDDTEVIYETIGPADSDQPSNQLDQPTEVHFDVKEFTDQLDLTRSLTSSPFLVPIKPYRPFSTEPLEVPPLEDPIILNPKYKDVFPNINIKEVPPATRFKLPISAQYNPESLKKEKVDNILANSEFDQSEYEAVVTKEIEDIKKTQIKSEKIEITDERIFKEKKLKTEAEYLEKMRKDIDLEKIEATASILVDESLQAAVSVADEVKKEVDVQLKETSESKKSQLKTEYYEESKKESSVSQLESNELNIKKESLSTTEIKESEKVVSNLAELIDKTTEEITQNKESARNMKEYESKDSRQVKAEEKISSIKTDVVKERGETTTKEKINRRESGSQQTSSKLLSEQRAYTIGLQTIPNIRGIVTSSHHYNLLLKTFFIHLTDVMVALSRFILSEPATVSSAEKESKTLDPKQEQMKRDVYKESKHERKESLKVNNLVQKDEQTKSLLKENVDEVSLKDKERRKESMISSNEDLKLQEVKKHITISNDDTQNIEQQRVHLEDEEFEEYEYEEDGIIRKTRLSGAKIAQIEGHKPEELTNKMDKVISEFQNKSGISELIVHDDPNQGRRRSRSRSRQKDELKKLSMSAEYSSESYSKKQVMNVAEKMSERHPLNTEIEKKTIVSSVDNEISAKEDGKMTYVAIVKSHVYTNKEAIFEEQMRRLSEMSEKRIEESTIQEQSMNQVEQKIEVKEFVDTKKVELPIAKEVIETIPIEQKHETFEVPPTESKKPQITVEKSVLAVPETVIILAEESKDVSFEVSKVKDAKAKVDVESFKAAETTIISVEEPKQREIEVPQVISKQPHVLMEESAKVVAEATVISLVEAENIIPAMEKPVTKETNVRIEAASAVTEASVVALETTTKELEKTLTISENKANVEYQQSKVASISETMAVTEVRDESFEITGKSATVNVVVEKPVVAQAKVQEVNVQEAKCEIVDVSDETTTFEEVNLNLYKVELAKEEKPIEEFAELKIVKEQIIEVTPPIEVYEDFDFGIKKIGIETDISQNISQNISESSFMAMKSSTMASAAVAAATVQSRQENIDIQKSVTSSIESSVTSSERKLTLRTDLTEVTTSQSNADKTQAITETPSPTSAVPPTPLVEEYVFKLVARLPSRETTPVPRDSSFSPEDFHEDPNIVKKKLVPQVETKVDEPIIYDPPLPSPPTFPKKKVKPVYSKPGLLGGSDEVSKEEILEIERKSTLLASAIDKTIKSIEKYKESVGMESDQEISVHEESHSQFSSSKTTIEEISQNGEVHNEYVVEETNGNGKEYQHETTIEEIQSDNKMMNGYSEMTSGRKSVVSKDENDSVKEAHVIDIVTEEHSNGFTETNREITESKTSSYIETEDNQNTVSATVETVIETKSEDDLDNGNDVTFTIFKNNRKSSGTIIESANEEVMKVKEEEERESEVKKDVEEKPDPMQGYRPVQFDPEAFKNKKQPEICVMTDQNGAVIEKKPPYVTDTGEIIGSQQGIVDGLEEAVVEPELAKELGKPGIPEEKIAELISGEAEMLREAHVMGLTRVLTSHMHRYDDSSVDFKKIKPFIESLKDSEVLKALNEEIIRSMELKKKEERKWTTFLQKPARQTPKQRMVFIGNKEDAKNCEFEDAYKVRIVKQPKPKVAPDYKPEDFDTGPLPWEERAVIEQEEAALAPPVEPEEPILVPEESPEIVVAVDPLPESEVPDLEDTGIPLPPSPLPQEIPEVTVEEDSEEPQQEEFEPEVVEEQESPEEMDTAERLMRNIESMVDPNASLDQQLAQMRSQLAALAQLPSVIQQTLELVTRQISQISCQQQSQVHQEIEVQEQQEELNESSESVQEEVHQEHETYIEEENEQAPEEEQPSISEEELARMKKEEEERIIEEQRRLEKQKKELIEQMRIEQESRQVKQRSAPRVGKPRPMFGPPVPHERPVVLPGGRKWRKPADIYNEQLISETLSAQAEIIKGKAKGVNFMKYEKPPVSLDHLQRSDVYKVIHNMDQTPLRRVEMLTPVIAEADYRERVRSVTPSSDRMEKEERFDQLQP